VYTYVHVDVHTCMHTSQLCHICRILGTVDEDDNVLVKIFLISDGLFNDLTSSNDND